LIKTVAIQVQGASDMREKLMQDLKRQVTGKSELGGNASRSVKPRLWSGLANTETIASVECRCAEDVQAAVRIAIDHELTISTLGGGHDWVGRSVCKNGITLDMRHLNTARYDPQRKSLTAGGGTVAGAALDCLPGDLAVVTGVSRDVGLTGLALGGGYGKLNSCFGLVTDTLRRVELVLADGSLVSASDAENSDLFWAIRGAGKNFGVVTSAEYSVFDLPMVLTGKIFYSLPHSGSALRVVQDALDQESRLLSIFSSFVSVPGMGFGLLLEPLWTGGEKDGERFFDQLAGREGAVVIQRQWCPYGDVFAVDEGAPNGHLYRMDAHSIARLTDGFIDTIVDCAARTPSENNTIMFHDFHGASAHIAKDATSFSLRENHYNMQIVASWSAGAAKTEAAAQKWLQDVVDDIAPFSMPGAYPAVLGLESHERARAFHSDGTLDRLIQLKARYDPHNRFPAAFGLF
jgi:FAD/FMN-containing dehydrogenase